MITVLYESIYSDCKSIEFPEKSRQRLRCQFENDALIYVTSIDWSSWRKPSECVWSTAARLRDKFSLNGEYEKLRGLFVDKLGVKRVTLAMAIKELEEAGGRQSTSVEEVKASLQTVNSLLSSESGTQRPNFGESSVFPVRNPEGTVQCVPAQTQFFIVDRESLRLSFEDRVKFLDFSLEEVNDLRPFLEWAGLEDRYVTRRVRESTSVQAFDARPIFKPGREIRHRAHALLRYVRDFYVDGGLYTLISTHRIAWHFKSPRVATTGGSDAVYDLLRNAKILETDTLCLEISLSQDGKSHKAEGDSIDIHLDEVGSNLKVYLPCEPDHQDRAFNMCLPKRILQWLMTDAHTQICKNPSEEAIIAATDIWNTPLSTLPQALDKCGIRKIDTLDIDAHNEYLSTNADSHDGNSSRVMDTPPSAPDTMHHESPATYSRTISPAHSDGTENESNYLPVRLAAQSRPATPLEEFLSHDTHYVRILGRVIASARTSTIPNRNENQGNTAWRGSSNIYGSDQFERDCKVGAAGELFVGRFFPTAFISKSNLT